MIRQPGPLTTRLTPTPIGAPDEALVTDTRAGLTPAQFVERKLLSLLKRGTVSVSHGQGRSHPGSRGR